jgi:hypothetical protein
VIGHRRMPGGNFEVTWSIAPGRRVKRTIPVESYNEGTVAELTRDIEANYTRKEPNE